MSVLFISAVQVVCQRNVQTVIYWQFIERHCCFLSCIEWNVNTVSEQWFEKDLEGSDNDIIKCDVSD
jgi:hypothetical protein